jgi:hypothetical protein
MTSTSLPHAYAVHLPYSSAMGEISAILSKLDSVIDRIDAIKERLKQ